MKPWKLKSISVDRCNTKEKQREREDTISPALPPFTFHNYTTKCVRYKAANKKMAKKGSGVLTEAWRKDKRCVIASRNRDARNRRYEAHFHPSPYTKRLGNRRGISKCQHGCSEYNNTVRWGPRDQNRLVHFQDATIQRGKQIISIIPTIYIA